MPATHDNYTQADLESAKRHLTDILTVTPLEAAELARQHPDEVTKLAITFAIAKDQLHQNWADALMAKVPLSAWEERSEYKFRIAPTKAASMRFLSRGEPADDANKLKERRRALHGDLMEQMDNPTRLAYRPTLEWVEIPTAWPNADDLTLAADTVFGHSLEVIEGLLRDQVHIYEQNYRKDVGMPPSVTTPIEVSLLASEKASHAIAAQIDQFCVLETEVDQTVKESLLARASFNISVNRALLENAAIDARGLEAAEMCIPFIERLNRHGMFEIPDELHNATDGGSCLIRELFNRMFAAGGMLASVDDYFKRHMTDSDIDMIVSWSHQLQESYITSRGMGGDWEQRGGKDAVEEQARAAHGSPAHRFIFAIAMAAAFYETAKTAREFTGHSNPTYSVFPDRGDTAKGLRHTPPAHAAELLKQAYGQIYFGNDGWELRADKLQVYARTCSAKRSHIQQLLYFAVKNRSSRQLFSLFQHLKLMMVPRMQK